MVKTQTPKSLWDDCLEYESIIRYNTAHDIYELQVEVPETIVSGGHPISQKYATWDGTNGASTVIWLPHFPKTSNS